MFLLYAGLPKNAGAASRVVPRVASGFPSGFSRRGDRNLESDIYYGEGKQQLWSEVSRAFGLFACDVSMLDLNWTL